MRKATALLLLILLILGAIGFAPSDRLPGKAILWVRPEELVRGPGTPEIVVLIANGTGRPLALDSMTTTADGCLRERTDVREPLPILSAQEAKVLSDVLHGLRSDFPAELAVKTCILSVPVAVEFDGLTERTVKLSACLEFNDGSTATLETTALLTTSLPAEPGWVAGDGHIHSNFSDGAYSIYQRRNDAINFGYKWIFMTDHSGSLSSTYADYVYTCGHAADSSLAIGADQEVSAVGGGHYLAYRCNQPLWDGVYSESYLPTYVSSNNPPNSFGGVAHPNHSSYPWTDFPRTNPGFRFIELFSNERIPKGTTLAEWRQQLNIDRPGKIAAPGDSGPFTVAVSGSDAHFIGTPYWGKNMTYLKANLTPPAIAPAYQALLAGQAIASGDGSFARFTMGGKEIGQVLRTQQSSISVSYYIKGSSPGTIIRWFRLIRVSDGSIVPNSGEVPYANLYQGTKTVTFAASDDVYYLEVELQDSAGVIQRVYTNPIFLDR